MTLLHNDIDDSSWNNDYLHNLLAVSIARGALIGKSSLFCIFATNTSRELDCEASLSTELNRHCDLRVFHLLLVPRRPLSITNRTALAKLAPQFFCNVRSKRSNEHHKSLQNLLAATFRQLIDCCHEGGYGSVVRELLDVVANLLDKLME